jgi:antitoxin HicB
MLAYPIKLTKDDNGTFLVTVPDFPEVTTFGRDVKSAYKHAIDAIEEAIAARMAEREPIPEPSKGKYTVALPAQAAAKILIYRAMRHRGVSKNELARRLRLHRPQVDRLLNLRHATRLDAIEQALGVLGKRMKIAVEERDDG